MKTTHSIGIYLVIMLCSCFSSIAVGQTMNWVKHVESTNQSNSVKVLTDDALNVYMVGSYEGTIDLDPGIGILNKTATGLYDIYIQKLDSAGNLIWGHSIGGIGHETLKTADIDGQANLLITGTFKDTVDFDPNVSTYNLMSDTSVAGIPTSDVFILKLDSSGAFSWATKIGGLASDHSYNLKVDAQNNVYTMGQFYGTIDFEPGAGTTTLTSTFGGNSFLQKLNSTGSLEWAIKLDHVNNSSDGRFRDITFDAVGNPILIGTIYDSLDFDPGPGTYYLYNSNINNTIGFIEKLDVNGDFLWAKIAGLNAPNGEVLPFDVESDGLGNIYTAGFYYYAVDFDPGPGTYILDNVDGYEEGYIQKLDSNGDFIWAKALEATNFHNEYHGLALDDASNVYLSGVFYGTADFDPNAGTTLLSATGTYDGFLQKLSSNGDLVWARTWAGVGSGKSIVESVAIDDLWSIYISGGFDGTVDFDINAGTSQLSSTSGTWDPFIEKLNQCENGSIENQIACTDYLWPVNGVTYTSSGSYATTLPNSNGCDSVVTLNLEVNYPNSATDVQIACDSYLWIDGNTYSTNNNLATWTLTNVAGCDSIVTLDLTISYSNLGTDVQTACDTYTWIDGNTYTSSNSTATHTLTNVAGCDSVVTLNLTVETVDNGVTYNIIGGPPYTHELTSNQNGATYQWLNCPAMTPISGATNQSFTVTGNGEYAVEVTNGSCIDTSVCASVTSVGIVENNFGNELLIYPNPTDGNFSIDLGQAYNAVTITITDLNGKLIQSNTYNESQLLNLRLDEPDGIYLLMIESEEKKAVIRLMKE